MDETAVPELPPLSARVLNVFIAPSQAMAPLRENPAWVGAAALGSLLVLLSNVLIPTEIFAEAMRQAVLERGGPAPRGLESGAALFHYGGAIVGAVIWWVAVAIMAGLVTLVFAFLLGDEGTYRRYLAVVAHAFVISAVGALVLVPLRISAGDASLLLSVGTLLPFLEEGYLARVLGALDLFGLWTWVVVGIGVVTIEPKRKVGGAIAVALVFPVALALVIGLVRR